MLSEKSLHYWQSSRMVNGQIQKVWEPGLGWPGQSHKEKLGIGLTQHGQDLGEELVRWEGIQTQVLPETGRKHPLPGP